jgi:hypothetical protein
MGEHEGSCGTGGWMPGGMGWGMGRMGWRGGHCGKLMLIGLSVLGIMGAKKMMQGEGMHMPGMMGGRWMMGSPWMKGGIAPWRRYITAEEKIAMLEEYLKQLQEEEKGVQEKIEHLRTKTGGGGE